MICKKQKQTAALCVSVSSMEGYQHSPMYKQTEDLVMTLQIISQLPKKADEVRFVIGIPHIIPMASPVCGHCAINGDMGIKTA